MKKIWIMSVVFLTAWANLFSMDEESESVFWKGSLEEKDWKNSWGIRKKIHFGEENLSFLKEEDVSFLRVKFPRGSWSPKNTREAGAPVGGSQFLAYACPRPMDEAYLSYFIRFAENFDFVKGGKLPGLFGGVANTGGKIPNGKDGFTTRLMWRKNGDGEVYAYLPSSQKYGDSLGRGTWRFQRGKWQKISQWVKLNDEDKSNGAIIIWLDDKKVFEVKDLTFRHTKDLKIEGIIFSTFFGGSDFSWAATKDEYIDFADFNLSAYGVSREN